MTAKRNDLIDKITGVLIMFFFNLAIFSFCMIFLDMRFINCLYYSFFNAIWMPFVIPVFLGLIDPIDFKKLHKKENNR
jgi:hypothetical protein